MGFLDRLFGTQPNPDPVPRRVLSDDERAIERYRYLLRTAPPETIEQVHAEAFSRLTDQQRAAIYEELSSGAGTGERPLSSEPATLARAATRAELRQPGSMERVLAGPSFGSMLGASLLGTVSGYVIGSALMSAFLPWGYDAGGTDGAQDAGDAGAGTEATTGADTWDAGSADFGGDFGGGFDGF